MEKARANGKTLGTPRKMTDLKLEMARSFRRDGLSYNKSARLWECQDDRESLSCTAIALQQSRHRPA